MALNAQQSVTTNRIDNTRSGYKKKFDVWVPHELSIKNMMDRINICDTQRNEIEPILKRMMTADEKWITYDNRTRKRSWIKEGEKAQAIAKPIILTMKKVMLCVWRNWKGIHYELLSPDQTINSELYCEQLERLQQTIERKRPELINRGVVFYHENARPHIFDNGKNYESLAGKSLQNSLNGIKLASKEACENHLKQFFDQKPQKFYCDEIMALP
ncbi:PREDICTED: histone-lysine N-methyltransferase SETMAR-like [Acromyrmex echinatior]|uniref:histone-lysine N-methyltransferase SETMAR-like n=1 Tax=Acromyrmex echinatior TaxID=103372 RepID=UPI000580F58B|nr:PREDICTED: histone-lysine N-methyltransferase SETMAR-like [Acromyrmex echinatior]